MYAINSTETIDMSQLSPRIVAMVRVLLGNSEILDWCPRGSVELHFNDREVHGKIAAALYTEERNNKPLPELTTNGKGG